MSLVTALNISLSGIKTTSLQLEQTASNIANASSEGYTTKSVRTTSAMLGAVGGGVKVTGFARSENAALFNTLSTATSDSAYRSTQNDYLQQVMDMFGTSSSDDPALSQAITAFVTSWNTLSATPESLVNQRQVVSDAEALCDEVKRIASVIEELDRQCKSEIETTLSDLNSYLQQIQDFNIKIAQAKNADLSSGDLEDARDQLILKVSEITEVSVMDRINGQIALYTTSGYQLVDGDTVRDMIYDGQNVVSADNESLVLNSALSGGKLQSLVYFRLDTSSSVTAADITTSLTNANSYLSQIQTLNTQIVAEQALGNDTTILQGQRSALVTQLSGVAAVITTNNPDGSITLTASNGYELLNGASMAVLSFSNGHVVDAADPTASLNATLTGGSLEIQLASYSGLASASTDQATSVIQKLRDQLDEVVRAFTETVTTASSGAVSFAAAYNNATTSAGNLASSFFTGTNRTNFTVNAALVDGTATLKANSAFDVSESLLDATRSFTADGLDISSSSYSSLVTNILTGFQQAANNVATLYSTAETSRSYLQERHANETGVNTDSELVKLVEFQNAYAASAHVMSVVQELYKVLQNIT